MNGSCAVGWAMLMVAVGGCAAPEAVPVSEMASVVGSWVWSGEPAAGGRVPTLTVERDGRLHGTSGVNRYQGQLDPQALARGIWSVAGLSATEMAGPLPAMDAERRFLRAIGGAEAARTGDGTLELWGDGRVVAQFDRLGR